MLDSDTAMAETTNLPNRAEREHIYSLGIQTVALLGLVVGIRLALPSKFILGNQILRPYQAAWTLAAIATTCLPLVLFSKSRQLATRLARWSEQAFDDSPSFFLLTAFFRCAGLYFLLEVAFLICRQVAVPIVLCWRREISSLIPELDAAAYLTICLPFGLRLFVGAAALFGAEKLAWLLNRKGVLSAERGTEKTTALILPRLCQVSCIFFGTAMIVDAVSKLSWELLTQEAQLNPVPALATVTIKTVAGLIFILGNRRIYALMMESAAESEEPEVELHAE